MKVKILAALKTKYSNLGLGSKTLEAIADSIAAKNIEEDAIESEVEAVGAILKTFQSDTDKRVNDAVSAAKKEPKQENGGDPAKEAEPKTEDAEPEWAKKLAERLDKFEQGNAAQSRSQAIENRLKDADPAFKAQTLKSFPRMQFENDEAFEAFLEETATDAEAFTQSLTERSLGAVGKPLVGANATAAKTLDADIKAWADSGKSEK